MSHRYEALSLEQQLRDLRQGSQFSYLILLHNPGKSITRQRPSIQIPNVPCDADSSPRSSDSSYISHHSSTSLSKELAVKLVACGRLEDEGLDHVRSFLQETNDYFVILRFCGELMLIQCLRHDTNSVKKACVLVVGRSLANYLPRSSTVTIPSPTHLTEAILRSRLTDKCTDDLFQTVPSPPVLSCGSQCSASSDFPQSMSSGALSQALSSDMTSIGSVHSSPKSICGLNISSDEIEGLSVLTEDMDKFGEKPDTLQRSSDSHTAISICFPPPPNRSDEKHRCNAGRSRPSIPTPVQEEKEEGFSVSSSSTQANQRSNSHGTEHATSKDDISSIHPDFHYPIPARLSLSLPSEYESKVPRNENVKNSTDCATWKIEQEKKIMLKEKELEAERRRMDEAIRDQVMRRLTIEQEQWDAEAVKSKSPSLSTSTLAESVRTRNPKSLTGSNISDASGTQKSSRPTSGTHKSIKKRPSQIAPPPNPPPTEPLPNNPSQSEKKTRKPRLRERTHSETSISAHHKGKRNAADKHTINSEDTIFSPSMLDFSTKASFADNVNSLPSAAAIKQAVLNDPNLNRPVITLGGHVQPRFRNRAGRQRTRSSNELQRNDLSGYSDSNKCHYSGGDLLFTSMLEAYQKARQAGAGANAAKRLSTRILSRKADFVHFGKPIGNGWTLSEVQGTIVGSKIEKELPAKPVENQFRHQEGMDQHLSPFSGTFTSIHDPRMIAKSLESPRSLAPTNEHISITPKAKSFCESPPSTARTLLQSVFRESELDYGCDTRIEAIQERLNALDTELKQMRKHFESNTEELSFKRLGWAQKHLHFRSQTSDHTKT